MATCICGNRSAAPWGGYCKSCYKLTINEWPILLGTAIAAFARRAEVEGLVDTLEEACNHPAYCWSKWSTNGRLCTCRGNERRAALLRLAEMAMEGR